MLKRYLALLSLAALLLAGGATAAPITLTFDDVGLVHGSIVNTQYAGVSISAINTGGGPNLAVAFNSNLTGTRDADLEFGTGWAGGNLAPSTRLGNLLIIQENPNGCGDGICDAPDDEGSRPAGTIIFDFNVAVTSFGFDMVDLESLSVEDGSITFYDGAAFINMDMSTFMTGLVLGDRSANRVTPFLVANLPGLSKITRVELNFGGSAGIDNVTFNPVPEPSTAALLAVGVLALGARARSRRR